MLAQKSFNTASPKSISHQPISPTSLMNQSQQPVVHITNITSSNNNTTNNIIHYQQHNNHYNITSSNNNQFINNESESYFNKFTSYSGLRNHYDNENSNSNTIGSNNVQHNMVSTSTFITNANIVFETKIRIIDILQVCFTNLNKFKNLKKKSSIFCREIFNLYFFFIT